MSNAQKGTLCKFADNVAQADLDLRCPVTDSTDTVVYM